ncbi:MAG: hypothetical protein COB60_01325 [Flavobacteriaceae bacterium]|nr:MAG: hypothetical protein COB60_01325 [Flavobacteriaceae bacterium]
MIEKKIDLLLVKYFDNRATEEELLELQLWASKNETDFKQAVELHGVVQQCLASKLDIEKSFENFKKHRALEEVITMQKRYPWKGLLKYAALILALCTVGTWYFVTNSANNPAMASVDASKEIKLELGDGSVKVIVKGEEQQILNNLGKLISTQGKGTLTYTPASTKLNSLKESFNTLTIPYGKTFKLVLSDGTRVALNAGSSLRYPIHFGEKGTRKVYLDGEGYFEVTKNTAQPFIVSTSKHDIRVLGTKFNVNSYTEDNNMQTVLVEGTVGIYSNKKSFNEKEMLLLKPSQKATWKAENNQISVEYTSTDQYTAWVDGALMFVNTPFNEMIRKIERHFDVSIQNKDASLEKHVFTGKFEHETIDQVMHAIQLYSGFNYTKNNNQIIINRTLIQTTPMKQQP